MKIDRSPKVQARDIIGSTVNLGDIKDSVVKSVGRISAQSGETAGQLKPLLKKLVELMSDAPDQGVEPQVAAEALEEVKTLADAAHKPHASGFLPTIRKTLRTLRGFAEDLQSVPTIAAQFKGYVDQIGELITG